MYQRTGTLTDSVNVNLHTLPVGFGSVKSNVKGYALVQRETAHIDNIIEQCLSNTACSLDKASLLYAAEVLRDAMLALLSRGKAIDVLEMGTLYVKPKNGLEEITAGLVKDFKVVFSPSELTQSQAVNITVGGEAVPDYNPLITGVMDMDTMSKSGTITTGKCITVSGERLRLAGTQSDKCGLYFAPQITGGTTYDTDETKWKRAADNEVYKNMPSSLLVRVPSTLTDGQWYIVIRTKAPLTGIINEDTMVKTPRFSVWEKACTVE